MSNPAVTKLVRANISNLPFWMDDNIGESIHIHLGDFRLDITNKGLDELSESLYDTLNKLYDTGLDLKTIDPVFLSLYLGELLPNLRCAKIDKVRLGDLIAGYGSRFGFIKYKNVKDGRAMKSLKGDSSENEDHRVSHHVGQSSSERLNMMMKSISEQGYPYNNQYIILYGDQMLIRDGQHRASCLYYQHGDIEIPVLRLYFDESVDISYCRSYFKQFIGKLRRLNLRKVYVGLKSLVKGIRKNLGKVKRRIIISGKKKSINKMIDAYFE